MPRKNDTEELMQNETEAELMRTRAEAELVDAKLLPGRDEREPQQGSDFRSDHQPDSVLITMDNCRGK